MKKQLLNLGVAFAATVLLAGSALAQHTAPVRVETVPFTATAPTIDGVGDETSYSPAMDLDTFTAGGLTAAGDLAATIKLSYDVEALYIFMNITDDSRSIWESGDYWQKDCIEIFFDVDTTTNVAGGAYGTDGIQFRVNRMIAQENTGTVGRNAVDLTQEQVDGETTGWTVEVKCPWLAACVEGKIEEDFLELAKKAMGFEVNLADADAGGNRDGQMAWDMDSGREDNAWNDVNSFAVIKLSDHYVSAVKPVENSVFGVFPNPATNVVNFTNLEGVTSIEIVNLVGQIVKVVDVNAPFVAVNVSDLAKGNYFAKINTVNGVSTQKIAVR